MCQYRPSQTEAAEKESRNGPQIQLQNIINIKKLTKAKNAFVSMSYKHETLLVQNKVCTDYTRQLSRDVGLSNKETCTTIQAVSDFCDTSKELGKYELGRGKEGLV